MSTPPGWYPDPSNAGQQRYWDGSTWTANVQGSGSYGGAYGGAPVAPGQDKAGAALAAAIVSFFCCPLIAIWPFIEGRQAREQSQQSGIPINGTMQAAWVISIVVLVLTAIGIVVYGLLLAVGT